MTTNKVRLGIIGMGNIGKFHADMLAGKVPRCELIAVCSTSPAKLEGYKPLKIFTDGEELIRSGLVDAVIIATPHYQHTTLGIAALEAGPARDGREADLRAQSRRRAADRRAQASIRNWSSPACSNCAPSRGT